MDTLIVTVEEDGTRSVAPDYRRDVCDYVGDDLYRRGMEALRAGKTNEALGLFQEARRAFDRIGLGYLMDYPIGYAEQLKEE